MKKSLVGALVLGFVAASMPVLTLADSPIIPPLTLTSPLAPVVYTGGSQVATVESPVAGTVSGIRYNNSSSAVNVDTYVVTADFDPVDHGTYFIVEDGLAGTFQIVPKELTVSGIIGLNKEYDGALNTSVDYSAAVLNGVIPGDDVYLEGTTTAVATFADKNVGSGKEVTISGLSLGGADAGNYALASSATTTADILVRPISVSATPDTRVYDGTVSSSGTPTTTVGTIVAGDNPNFTQVFDTKDVGTGNKILIPAGSVDDGNGGANYDITLLNATTGTITPASLTAIAQGIDKVYDSTTDADVTLSDDHIGSDDVDLAYLSATFDTKDVGTNKAISVSGISISGGSDAGNYTLSNNSASTTADVTQKSATLTFDNKTKVYGESDPTFTYHVTGLVGSDTITDGVFARTPGEHVAPSGDYAIGYDVLYPFTAGPNYDLTIVGGFLDILPKVLTVTADDKSMTYGDPDPAFTVHYSGFVFGEDESVLDSGATAQVSGAHADAGTYPITVSGAHDNDYDFSYIPGTLTVNPKTVNVSANAQTKTYGNSDPSLDYVADALAGGDSYSGSLTRASGENVGSYAISQGSLTAGSNYTINFTGNNLLITPKSVTVTADAKSKVYGDADPALTYVGDALIGADSYSGSLTRDAGENVGSYQINQGSITAGSNYSITYVSNNLGITQRPLSVEANSSSKEYLSADPAFTYNLTSGSLVLGDSFSGALTRDPGEELSLIAGPYAITQGTLTAGGNYSIAYTPGALTIVDTAAPVVTLNGGNPVMNFTSNGYTELGAAVADNHDVGLTPVITGSVNGSVAGAYTLTYTATDASGNSASTTRTVNMLEASGGSGGGGSSSGGQVLGATDVSLDVQAQIDALKAQIAALIQQLLTLLQQQLTAAMTGGGY